LTLRNFFLISVILGLPQIVQAHELELSAEIFGRNVLVRAIYSDGTYAAAATVTVESENGNELLQGKTDAKGWFLFAPPMPENLNIRIEIGHHQAALAFSKEEILRSLPKAPDS
jgi:hypothetical protein